MTSGVVATYYVEPPTAPLPGVPATRYEPPGPPPSPQAMGTETPAIRQRAPPSSAHKGSHVPVVGGMGQLMRASGVRLERIMLGFYYIRSRLL